MRQPAGQVCGTRVPLQEILGRWQTKLSQQCLQLLARAPCNTQTTFQECLCSTWTAGGIRTCTAAPGHELALRRIDQHLQYSGSAHSTCRKQGRLHPSSKAEGQTWARVLRLASLRPAGESAQAGHAFDQGQQRACQCVLPNDWRKLVHG